MEILYSSSSSVRRRKRRRRGIKEGLCWEDD